jgi:hypothetical protein
MLWIAGEVVRIGRSNTSKRADREHWMVRVTLCVVDAQAAAGDAIDAVAMLPTEVEFVARQPRWLRTLGALPQVGDRIRCRGEYADSPVIALIEAQHVDGS